MEMTKQDLSTITTKISSHFLGSHRKIKHKMRQNHIASDSNKNNKKPIAYH